MVIKRVRALPVGKEAAGAADAACRGTGAGVVGEARPQLEREYFIMMTL